ncbi:acetyltransferase [Rhodopirellula halodulae]|uniref:acetyltransferase n=1 Tax=Rhodopirellula halodulae TaxID=2894198 RepID=UPI001E5F171F|nr:acetyltransferase [Rhodopirellula sp. JC737]MCC9657175.1 acetyltransferase [Rhodopirellula sp. JC737]
MDVLQCLGTSDPLFDWVQEIRRDGSNQTLFDFDDFSRHYVLVWEGQPLGALTVQEASEARLDCEDHYPSAVFERHRDQLFGTCKLRIRRGPATPMLALRTLVRGLWQDQLQRGKRICIVNAEHRMRAFYRRIGFSHLPGFDFVHPQLSTQSIVLLMGVDTSQRSYCQDLFETIHNPVDQQALVEACCGSLAGIGLTSKTGPRKLAVAA